MTKRVNGNSTVFLCCLPEFIALVIRLAENPPNDLSVFVLKKKEKKKRGEAMTKRGEASFSRIKLIIILRNRAEYRLILSQRPRRLKSDDIRQD